ncbi:MAG: MDR family MFS transporter [Aggregatilineales bacterium]
MFSAAEVWVRGHVSGLPRTFWYLFAGTFINRVGIFVLPFLSLYLTTQRGLSIERTTQIISLYGIGSFTSQIGGGFLSDRLGRRLTMIVSFFGTAALEIILGSVTDFGALAVTTLLFGLFSDLYRPASSALIADVVPAHDRPRAFALRYWAINLGAAIGLALGGIIAQHGFVLLFIGDALTTACFGVIILLFVPETRPTAQAATVSPVEGSEHVSDQRRPLIFAGLFALLTLCSASVYYQSNVTMPLDMQAKGLSTTDYGAAMALNGLVIVLVSLPIARRMAHVPPFRVMAVAALLIGSGVGWYALSGSAVMYALGVIIWTFGELIGSPIGSTIMAEVAPIAQRGLYQGILGAGFGLATFVGPIGGGFVYERWGSAALWIGCLAVNLTVAVIYLLLMSRLYRRLPHHIHQLAVSPA